MNNKFYEVSTIQGHTSIDVVDLDRQMIYEFEDLSKQMNFGEKYSFEGVKEINGKLYMILGYFDENSLDYEGYQELYIFDNKKLTYLCSAKHFNSIIVIDNTLYYTDSGWTYGMMSPYGSLHKLDLLSKQHTEIRNEKDEMELYNFVYDMIMTQEKDSIPIEGAMGLQSKGDYLYVQGGMYTRPDDEKKLLTEESIYRINIKTNEHQKLTRAASKFWIIKDELYFIDASTHHLVRTDLDGKDEKTIIASPIKHITPKNNVIYYSIKSKKNTGSGLYAYNIETELNACVSTDDSKDLIDIKDLIVNNQGIYYIKEDNTLYKIEEEKSKLIDKDIEWCMKTADYIVYNSLSKPTLYVVQ